MVGTTAFNKKKLNFNKEKKLKARVKRKAMKLEEKHKEQKVKLVKRTKKNQKKADHRARMADKAKLLLGDQAMVDAPGASSKARKRAAARGNKKATGSAAAAGASKPAAPAADVMQE